MRNRHKYSAGDSFLSKDGRRVVVKRKEMWRSNTGQWVYVVHHIGATGPFNTRTVGEGDLNNFQKYGWEYLPTNKFKKHFVEEKQEVEEEVEYVCTCSL